KGTAANSCKKPNGEVEEPRDHGRERRGRTISQRPRRRAASASRTPPTIVRHPQPVTRTIFRSRNRQGLAQKRRATPGQIRREISRCPPQLPPRRRQQRCPPVE